jgi:hypothetical protein
VNIVSERMTCGSLGTQTVPRRTIARVALDDCFHGLNTGRVQGGTYLLALATDRPSSRLGLPLAQCLSMPCERAPRPVTGGTAQKAVKQEYRFRD